MNIAAIGLHRAKNVFQAHGIDQEGRVIVRKQIRRPMVSAFFAKLSPCLVGMEACGSAHHWAWELKRLGHDVRLMRENAIFAIRTRKHKVTTDSNHKFSIAPNLLDRDFTAQRPNQKSAPLPGGSCLQQVSRDVRVHKVPRASSSPPSVKQRA